MALSFLDNVDYRGKKPNFTRDLFETLSDMISYSENYLPDVFIACCKENGKVYIFNRENPVDPDLGKWREFEGSGTSGDENVIEGISVNGTALTPDANKNVDITVPTVSTEADNMIETKTDGLYVKDMSTKISAETDNTLVEKADGLYVAPADLSEYAKLSTSNYVTLYVDNINGSDDNDGLTTSTPIKTIDTVLIKKKTQGNDCIHIRLMSDYTGNINLEGFHYCQIRNNNSGNANVSAGITFKGISYVELYNITIPNSASGGITFSGSSGVVSNCSATVLGNALNAYAGNVGVTNSTLNYIGNMGAAIYVGNGGQVNIGRGCTIGGSIATTDGTINILSSVYDTITGSPKHEISGSGSINIDGIPVELMEDIYSKAEVDELLSKVSSLNIEIVTDLPTTDISKTTIYLLQKADTEEKNSYLEYLNLDGTVDGWECIGGVGGGSSTFTDEVIVNNPIGKIASGADLKGRDVMSVLIDMLTVDVPTEIKLIGSPSATTLNEKGVTTIADVALTATITLGTGKVEDGASIEFKKDGVVIDTQTFVDGTLTYSYTDTGANIADNTVYSVEVVYTMGDTQNTARDSITYKFAYPLFRGVSATASVADPATLIKLVSNNTKQTLSYTANNEYLALCIPSTMSISSIKDSNNFENIDSWGVTTQDVTIGSNTVSYRIYVTATPVTCTNFTYVFTLV